MIYTDSDSFDSDLRGLLCELCRDDQAQGRAHQQARPRDEHRQRRDLAQPLHGDEQVVVPSTDIKKQTPTPINSEMPAVAPCPSSRGRLHCQNRARSWPRRQDQRQLEGGAGRVRRPSSARSASPTSPPPPFDAGTARPSPTTQRGARRRDGRHMSTTSRTKEGRRRTAGGLVGPSTDKSCEPKGARSDGQRQHSQRTCVQRARLQGQSSKKHRHNSGNREEALAEARQPPHGHSAHFTCHAT